MITEMFSRTPSIRLRILHGSTDAPRQSVSCVTRPHPRRPATSRCLLQTEKINREKAAPQEATISRRERFITVRQIKQWEKAPLGPKPTNYASPLRGKGPEKVATDNSSDTIERSTHCR